MFLYLNTVIPAKPEIAASRVHILRDFYNGCAENPTAVPFHGHTDTLRYEL